MSNRYRREIEEILKQAGETPVPPPSSPAESKKGFGRLLWLYVSRSLGGRSWSLKPGRIMLIGVSLLVLALVFSRFIPGLGGPLALAGLLLFIVAYAMFFVKPSTIEKRWRGQSLDENSSWWNRFRKK